MPSTIRLKQSSTIAEMLILRSRDSFMLITILVMINPGTALTLISPLQAHTWIGKYFPAKPRRHP